MSEIKDEVMETIENEEVSVVNDYDYTEDEGGSGKVIGLVVAGVAGAAALGVAAYKKLKAKTGEEKPKKKRKKLMWVEVEDEVNESEPVDSTAEVISEEEEATEK